MRKIPARGNEYVHYRIHVLSHLLIVYSFCLSQLPINEYRIKTLVSKNVRTQEKWFHNGRETDFVVTEEKATYCHKKSWTETELRNLPDNQTDCKENPGQPAFEGICSAADSSGCNPSLWWFRKKPRSLSKPLFPWNCWNPLSPLGDQWHWDHRKIWLWESSVCSRPSAPKGQQREMLAETAICFKCCSVYSCAWLHQAAFLHRIVCREWSPSWLLI